MPQDKKYYRKLFLQKRDLLPPEKHHELSRRIEENLFALIEVARAGSMMFYVSFGSEVGTHEMIKHCFRSGKTVVVPRVDKPQKRLVPYQINSFEHDLTNGTMGILEPEKDRCCEVIAKDIDIVIVPGLVFSEDGWRIGYGGGFYDRFLKEMKLKALALSFEMQIIDHLPVDPGHDVPVDCIVTEKRVVHC